MDPFEVDENSYLDYRDKKSRFSNWSLFALCISQQLFLYKQKNYQAFKSCELFIVTTVYTIINEAIVKAKLTFKADAKRQGFTITSDYNMIMGSSEAKA